MWLKSHVMSLLSLRGCCSAFIGSLGKFFSFPLLPLVFTSPHPSWRWSWKLRIHTLKFSREFGCWQRFNCIVPKTVLVPWCFLWALIGTTKMLHVFRQSWKKRSETTADTVTKTNLWYRYIYLSTQYGGFVKRIQSVIFSDDISSPDLWMCDTAATVYSVASFGAALGDFRDIILWCTLC